MLTENYLKGKEALEKLASSFEEVHKGTESEDLINHINEQLITLCTSLTESEGYKIITTRLLKEIEKESIKSDRQRKLLIQLYECDWFMPVEIEEEFDAVMEEMGIEGKVSNLENK